MANTTVVQAGLPAPGGIAAPTGPQRSQRDQAAEYLDESRFHRRLILPATNDHGPLTVTYAVTGAQSNSAPTVLFIGGMMGGRYLAMLGDFLCEKLGLKFVVVDRPGMGSSTNVHVSQRIAVWLETVPLLMKELNIKHVSILAHSCGVIYALNTIYAFPEILPPSNPTLTLFSPWVHPQQSAVTTMAVTSKLPSLFINHYNSVFSFISQFAIPSLAYSGALLTSASGALSPSSEESASRGQIDKPKHERDDLCREFLGVPAARAAALSSEMTRRVCKEDTTGANGEILLLMKKAEAGSWCVCDDYEKCPGELEARITERLGQQETEETRTSPSPMHKAPALRIDVFWAETDDLIGKKGEEYFDKCFMDHCGEQSNLQYRSEVVADADHNTLLFPQYGALPKALDNIARMA